MINKKIILPLIIGFAILISCNESENAQSKNSSTQNSKTETVSKESGIIGSQAPGFTLEDLSGKEVSLEDFEGKTVLLNFWATWCPPCRKEIPDLINLYKNQQENDIVVIGLSVDKRVSEAQLKKFVSEYEINYPVLDGSDAKIDADYGGIRGIPTTFLIDKKGQIRHKWVGPRTREQFMNEVKKYY